MAAIAALCLFKLFLMLNLSFLPSFFAALIYAVHPLHSEAVIPSSGRADLLCAIFVFGGLIFHIRSRSKPVVSVLLASICVLFSFWSKENGIILVPLCLVYDFFMRPQKFLPSRVFIYASYLLALSIGVWTRISVTGAFLPRSDRFHHLSDNVLFLCDPVSRIATAIWLQCFALWKFLWPLELSHDYSYAQILPLKSFFDPAFVVSVSIIISSVIAVLAFAKKDRGKIAFLILFYVISVLPTSNILALTGTVFGERLYYLPSAWLCAITGILLFRSIHFLEMKYFSVIFVSLLALMSLRTALRGEDWSSQMALCIKGVETAPKSNKTWINLAVELAKEGRYEEAIAACDRALEIIPDLKMALKNRAFYNIKIGRLDDAEKDLSLLVSLGTKNHEVYNKLGALLAERGEFDEAEKCWSKSLEILPSQKIIMDAIEKMGKDRLSAEKSDGSFEKE